MKRVALHGLHLTLVAKNQFYPRGGIQRRAVERERNEFREVYWIRADMYMDRLRDEIKRNLPQHVYSSEWQRIFDESELGDFIL